jgi:CheY-like chemotaxis protein
MPLMNGYEATKLIRDIDKNVPIISFSADTSEEDELYSKILGMNDSLTKPIDTEKLCAILLKYIPKKMEIKNNNMNFEEETIPQLEYLNIKKVVPSTLSSFSFYKCIALRFLEQYKNLKLNPELESFNETIYTLKGLSGTLGAEQLFEVITKLERNQSEELLNLFHKILELVCNEIRINFYNDENLVLCELKREISQEELKNLFEELKEVLKTKRPKTIHLVLVKFKEIVLNEDMDKLFSQVVKYLQEYEFDLAIKLIDGFIDN